MVLRRGLADTLEFLGAQVNLSHAAVVAQFGIDMVAVRGAHHSNSLGDRHGIA